MTCREESAVQGVHAGLAEFSGNFTEKHKIKHPFLATAVQLAFLLIGYSVCVVSTLLLHRFGKHPATR